MEPILNSGERITIGIAAVGKGGEIAVSPTLSEEVVRCAFGAAGAAFIGNAEICLESLRDALPRGARKWKAPLSGVELGKWNDAAADDLRGIIRNAMMLASSFSALAVSTETAPTLQSEREDDRWPRLIREATAHRMGRFESNFDKTMHLVLGARATKFDYLGERVAANFSKLVPNQLSAGLKTSKAKLWDLERLRDMRTTLSLRSYGLLAWRPKSDAAEYSERQISSLNEGIEELRAEAKKVQIETLFVNHQREAAEFIVEREAA